MTLPPPPPVVVEYVQPHCPHVAELAHLVDELRKRGVGIAVRDVSNAADLAEAKSIGVLGTPTVVKDGKLYAGDQAVVFLDGLLAGAK